MFYANRRALVAGVLSLLVTDAMQLLIPLVIKQAVDALTEGGAVAGTLLRYGGYILFMAGVMAAFRFTWRYFLLGHSRKVERHLRGWLYEHLQRMSMGFFQKHPSGDLMARATNDLNAVRMATGIGLAALTDALVMGTAAVAFMIWIHPTLAAIALIPAPIVVVVTRVYTRRMGRAYERVQNRFGGLTESVREAFAGIRVVKAYGRESWTREKIRTQGRHYVAENLGLAKSLGVFFPMMMVFTNLGLAIVIGLGGRLAILGEITTGDFVAFTTYLNLLTWPMMAMGWVTNLIQRGGASMRRINGILSMEPGIDDPAARGETFGEVEGRIEVRGLTWSYPEQERPVLEDVDLTVDRGATVALVGHVGCGKTTLLYTLARMLDPPPETVFIDGRDVRDIPLADLRGGMGFVTQEAVIFSDTIRNNVMFGREDVSEEQVWEALSITRMDEEVRAMDDGLDSVLGERGVTLSGGQRQRLTIARALVGEPPVLILDDALSMVDTRTEKAILGEVLDTRKDRTNLIVSHRVSTNRRADTIVVLERGRVVERGDHETLLREGPRYRRLYEIQKAREEAETVVGDVG